MFSVNQKIWNFLLIIFWVFLFFTSIVSGYQITFVPGLSITAEYTDNLEQDNEIRTEDYIFLISPQMLATFTGKTNEATLFYSPTFSSYKNASQNDTFRQLGRISGWNVFSKDTRLSLENAFIRTEEPNSQELQVEENIDTTTRGREVYYMNNSGMSLRHQFNPYSTITFEYGHRIYRNENPEVQSIENHQPSVGLTVWVIPGQVSMEVNALYIKSDYTGSIEDTDYDDDYQSWRVDMSLSKQFSRHLNAVVQYSRSTMNFSRPNGDYKVYDASLGINFIEDIETTMAFGIGYYLRDNRQSGYDSGVSLNMNINQSFKYGSINLECSGGYEELYFGDNLPGFSKYYQIGGTAQCSLSRNVTGELFGSFRNNTWEDIDPERKDDIFNAGSSINYQIFRWLVFNGSYIYRKVDSNIEENSFKENRFIVTINATTIHPLRLWN